MDAPTARKARAAIRTFAEGAISRDQRSKGKSKQTPKKCSAVPDPVAKHTHGRKQTCHNKRKCVDDPKFLAVVGGKIVSQPRQSGIQDSHVNADEKESGRNDDQHEPFIVTKHDSPEV